ncbi:site-specific integrase [Bacillus smithii]|uniref:site-specific integrase n=1 Tax=Bacillus smithii TaxID=1479 RepID=UPI002E1AA31A|nr:site-specific integrase [Bacillus smithii]
MKHVQPIRDPEKIEEVKNILKRKSYRDWFLFVMGINTGLRISDLLQLRVKDVKNKSHITIREKKTGKDKRFKVKNGLRLIIEEYIQGMDDEDFLFPSQKTNKPIQRVQAYKILNAAAKEAGLDEIGTHTLRKTFGYHFYQRTKDVALLQEMFNHSAPSITLRYIGINQDIMDKAMDEFELL